MMLVPSAARLLWWSREEGDVASFISRMAEGPLLQHVKWSTYYFFRNHDAENNFINLRVNALLFAKRQRNRKNDDD
jgi:hypothetical protein